MGESICKHVSNKELVENIYERLNSKKASDPIRAWEKDMERHVTKEHTQMANKQMKKYLTSSTIRVR